MIPAEAVEAAARALDPHTMGSAGVMAEKFKEATRAEARRALEAAAPYMLAGAWDDALEAGEHHCRDLNPSEITNPYRATK